MVHLIPIESIESDENGVPNPGNTEDFNIGLGVGLGVLFGVFTIACLIGLIYCTRKHQ